VEHHNLPTLQEAGMRAFYNVVFEAIKGELTRAGAFACAVFRTREATLGLRHVGC
jgi:hypothetical protein